MKTSTINFLDKFTLTPRIANRFTACRFTTACLMLFSISTMTKSVDAVQVERKPNVVIFYTDDQGTLDAGCYGSSDIQTPNIDRIAAQGVRFTQAYAHTVCCPSRAALLTGRHPQRSGINSWTQGNMKGLDGTNMALTEVTIAEQLKSAGYRTALFGKWHVGAHRDYGPKKQGFDEFFGIRNGFIDNFNPYLLPAFLTAPDSGCGHCGTAVAVTVTVL